LEQAKAEPRISFNIASPQFIFEVMPRWHQDRCRRQRQRRGFSTIQLVFLFPVLLMFAWMAVEIGIVVRSANKAKTAADAIALAAAARYADGPEAVRADALAAAATNSGPNGPIVVLIPEGPAGGGDVQFGVWDEDFRAFSSNQNGGPAARVTVRFAADHPNGAPSFIFNGFFNLSPVTLERTSIAVYNPPRHITSLLAVADSGTGIDMEGSARISARGGVTVASNSQLAVRLVGGARMEVPIVRVPGTIDETSGTHIDGAIKNLTDIPDDPFADAAMPIITAGFAESIDHDGMGFTRVAPGVHLGLVASGGNVILDPGLHQFAGGISLSGSAVLELDAATIQLAEGAAINLADSSSIIGKGSDSMQSCPGHWIVQRGASAEWRIADTAVLAVDGHCYAPNSSVTISDGAKVSMRSAVVNSITASSVAKLRLDGEIDALREPVVPGRARLVK
jgi:hypothetical protein